MSQDAVYMGESDDVISPYGMPPMLSRAYPGWQNAIQEARAFRSLSLSMEPPAVFER